MQIALSDATRYRRLPTLSRHWQWETMIGRVVGLHVHKGWGVAERAFECGEDLALQRDLENVADPNAVRVLAGERMIGYLQSEAAVIVAPELDRGAPLIARPQGPPYAGRESRGGSLPITIELS